MRIRPHLLLGLAVAAALGPLAACGSADSSSGPADAGGGTSTASDGFPVTIEHGQGTVEIPAKPTRVVALSWTDAQIAEALGAPVVAAVRNPDSEDGNWPATSFDGDVLSLDPVTPELEAIASHQPDLILMTAAQPTFGQEYEQLSQIAPTISYDTALLRDDGDRLAELIGAALGESAAAADLIASSDAAIAGFRAEHPALEGARVVFAQNYQGSTGAIVSDDSPVVRFFGRLGLTVPDELARLAGDDAAYGTVQLADENLDLLDTADAVFVNTPEGEDAFAAIPTVRDLALTEKGTLFFTGNELAGMLLTPTPATTDVLLDRLGGPLSEVAEALTGP